MSRTSVEAAVQMIRDQEEIVNDISRRTFLKGSLAAAIGVSLLPYRTVNAQSSAPLRIGINADPGTLDPHHTAGSIVGSRWHNMMFDQLTRVEAGGGLSPMLATHWRSEGNRWRFRLREGVRFHDGSLMVADDVVYSLERLLRSEFPSAIRTSFLPYIVAVREIAPLEVEIETPNPDPLLPLRLATPNAAIMPREGVEAAGFEAVQSMPIGAGPMRVREWRNGERLVLEPHTDYWGGVPNVGEVQVLVIPENATRIAALQAGEVDLITTVPPDLIGQIQGSRRLAVDEVLLNNFMHIYFNTVTGLTSNRDVRAALSLGIDRSLIAEALWQGRVRVMNDYFLPSEFVFDANRPEFPFDPDEAKRALERAGYAGEVLRFTPPATYYSNGRLVTDAVNEMWQSLGVNVDYEPLELAPWAERSLGGQQQATLQSFGTSGDPGAGSLFTEYVGGGWISQYYPVSDRFRALASEAGTSLNLEVRRSNYRELAGILDADVPFAPLYQSVEFYGVREGIRWQPHQNFYIDLRPDVFAWNG
jgi:peptide/nickel transport system substrate-binding protein